MTTINFLILFYWLSQFIKPCDCHYAGHTTIRLIAKLRFMESELVRELEMKQNFVTYVRRMYQNNAAFQVGDQIYRIKEKIKDMMSLYIKMESMPKPIEQLDRTELLVRIHQIAMEQDAMITFLEESEKKNEPITSTSKHFKKRKGLRTRNESKMDEAARLKKEADKIALRKKMQKISIRQEWNPHNKRQKLGGDNLEMDYGRVRF